MYSKQLIDFRAQQSHGPSPSPTETGSKAQPQEGWVTTNFGRSHQPPSSIGVGSSSSASALLSRHASTSPRTVVPTRPKSPTAPLAAQRANRVSGSDVMSLLHIIDQLQQDRVFLERMVAEREEFRERELVLIAEAQEFDLIRIEKAFDIRETEWRQEVAYLKAVQQGWDQERMHLIRELTDTQQQLIDCQQAYMQNEGDHKLAPTSTNGSGVVLDGSTSSIVGELGNVTKQLSILTSAVESMKSQWGEERIEWRITRDSMRRERDELQRKLSEIQTSPPQHVTSPYSNSIAVNSSIDALKEQLSKRYELEDKMQTLSSDPRGLQLHTPVKLTPNQNMIPNNPLSAFISKVPTTSVDSGYGRQPSFGASDNAWPSESNTKSMLEVLRPSGSSPIVAEEAESRNVSENPTPIPPPSQLATAVQSRTPSFVVKETLPAEVKSHLEEIASKQIVKTILGNTPSTTPSAAGSRKGMSEMFDAKIFF
eukprot:PhF_6_TR6308/c0_g1_i1/m.9560